MKLPRINLLISALVFGISIFSVIGYKVWQNNHYQSFDNNLRKESERLANTSFPASPLIDLETKEDVSANLKTGDFVLVYFSSNCEACKKELPILSQVQSKTKASIFLISAEEDEVIRNYANINNLKFKILIDKNAESFKALSLKYTPTNLKVKNGVIQKALIGSAPNEGAFLELARAGDDL